MLAVSGVVVAPAAMAADGLVKRASPYSVEATAERFVEKAKLQKLNIFKQVDHAAGAASVDMDLRPTHVIIFGNPKGGTPLMQCSQTMGIDLPMKALVWKDAEGQVWFGYNDPEYLAERHGASDCKPVAKIGQLLNNLSAEVVAEGN
jgi:uncharacterized protein (DUF302 family)